MKLLLTIWCYFIFSEAILAQRDAFTLSAGSPVWRGIPKEEHYIHKDFVKGVIHYKKRRQVFEKMNYNLLLEQMQFITNRGDTVNIGNDVYFKFIVLDRDTFYQDRFYYRVFKEYDKIKLIYKTGFAITNKSGQDSVTRFHRVINGAFLRGISAKDTIRLVRYEEYYMLDLRNTIYSLSGENLVKMYPHRRKGLSDYFYNNTAKLTNRKDVEKLMDFLNTKIDY